MLTEVDHRTLIARKDLRRLQDVLELVKPAWKHTDVKGHNFKQETTSTQIESFTFQLTEPVHTKDIESLLNLKQMTGLPFPWFSYLMIARKTLPAHEYLVCIASKKNDSWNEPRVLFTEKYVLPNDPDQIGISLRRFDYIWPAGTLVPATPLAPEVT